MAKLTDEEIINHYELRKETLSLELSKTEAVLNALKGGGTTVTEPAVTKRSYNRRSPLNTEAAKPRAAKAGRPKNTAPKAVKKAASKPADASAKDGPKSDWDSKIRAALSELRVGTKAQIIQAIANKDYSLTPERINKALTLRLAVMLKHGKLRRDLDKNTYSVVY